MDAKAKFRYSFIKKHQSHKSFKGFNINRFFDEILYPLNKVIGCDSFKKVIDNNFHFHSISKDKLINTKGFEKIANIAQDETVYQLKTKAEGRLIGIVLDNIFYIIGYDAKHTIYS